MTDPKCDPTQLNQKLADLEVRRQSLVRRLMLAVGGAIALVLFAMLGVPALDGRPFLTAQAPFIWGLGLVLGIGLVYVVGKPLGDLQRQFKGLMFSQIAHARGYGYVSMAGHPTHLEAFERFKLVRSDSDYRVTTDRLTGERGGLAFDFSIVKLTRRAPRGASVTIFHGVLMSLRLPRALQGIVVLRRDHGVANALTAMDTAKIKSRWGTLQPVPITNPAFESVFEVFATHPRDAEGLLTPYVMTQLLDLDRLFGGSLRCALLPTEEEAASDQCTLMIAADTGPWFRSPSEYEPITKPSVIDALSADIDRVEAVIDTLLGQSSSQNSKNGH